MVGRPAASAAATISAPSSASMASGFSHATILPAASAARAISRCELFGVQMSTRSTSGRSTTRRQSVSVSCHPQRSAKAASAPGVRADATFSTGSNGRSKKRPTCRYALEWARPMKP